MRVNIRKASLNDANNIANVHIVSWKAIYRGQVSDAVLNNLSLQKRTEEWQERLSAGVNSWVAELNHKVIGFISTCPSRDSDDDPTKVVEISAIYLLPEYWRRGIGLQLCQIALEDAIKNKFDEASLWVLAANQSARAFYESMGFYATNDFKMDHSGCESLKVIRYRKKL